MENNISKLYIINFFSQLTFNAAIWMIYLQRHEISIFQISILQSILNFGMLVFEIPTGILADKSGRKFSIVAGILFLLIYTGLLTLYPYNFIVMIVSFFIAGIGYALISGSLESLLYDSLHDKSRATEALGKLGTFGNFGAIVGLIGGGFLDHIFGGKMVYVATFLAYSISFIGSFFIMDKKILKENCFTENKPNIKENIIRYLHNFYTVIYNMRNYYMIIICFSFIVTIISLYYLFSQDIFYNLNINTRYIGIIFALSHLFEGIANYLAHKFSNKLGAINTIKKSIILIIFCFCFSFYNNRYLAITFFIIINFLFGILDPIILDIINKRFVDKHRTALNSSYNFLSSLSMFILAPILGAMAEYTFGNIGFWIYVFGIFMLLFVLIMLNTSKILK